MSGKPLPHSTPPAALYEYYPRIKTYNSTFLFTFFTLIFSAFKFGSVTFKKGGFLKKPSEDKVWEVVGIYKGLAVGQEDKEGQDFILCQVWKKAIADDPQYHPTMQSPRYTRADEPLEPWPMWKVRQEVQVRRLSQNSHASTGSHDSPTWS